MAAGAAGPALLRLAGLTRGGELLKALSAGFALLSQTGRKRKVKANLHETQQ